MIDDKRILTLHPQGKKGVNILRSKFETIKDFILQKISHHEEITYQDVSDMAIDELSSSFDGKVAWYVVSVKLDLEAQGIIERVPKSSPHKIRIKLA